MQNFKCKYEYTIIRLFKKSLSKNKNEIDF